MPLTLNHDDQLAYKDEATSFTASVTVSNADFTLDKASAGSTAIYARQNGSNRFALNVESDGWSMYSNNGTTWSQGMFMSNGGIVRKPFVPAFSCGAPNGDSAGVWIANAVFYNNGSHYNNSNGRFTAPVSGHYFFYHWAMGEASGAGTLDVYSRINGNRDQVGTAYNGAGGSYPHVSAQYIRYMNAGDYVDVYMGQGNYYNGGDGRHGGWGGHFVG